MKENPAAKLMDEIITKHNFINVMKNTYGVAVLDNGMYIKLLNNFEGVCETWKLFNEALVMNDDFAVNTILTENTRGGIIDTGSSVINIQNIISMYPVYRIARDTKKEVAANRFKEEAIDQFLYWNTIQGTLEDPDD